MQQRARIQIYWCTIINLISDMRIRLLLNSVKHSRRLGFYATLNIMTEVHKCTKLRRIYRFVSV